MEHRARIVLGISLGVTGLIGAASRAVAQGPPDYDFQWTTIGNTGNAPYVSGNPNDVNVNGHGQVSYAFRASTLEVTTSQWMEFLNAFAPIDNSPLQFRGPLNWGAYRAQTLPNGHFLMALDPLRPNAGMLPIGGITWRDAARYLNWLQNGKQVSVAAISTGAYDTTTWGFNEQTGRYTDAPNRMPGAMFFLPTLDEYLKAVHYDPNRYGTGQGGYWQFDTSSDTAPVGGLPGIGETSANYRPDGSGNPAWNIPLGSYATVQTPWGLLDASGGGQEWLEVDPGVQVVSERPLGGSYAGMIRAGDFQPDYIGFLSGFAPDVGVLTSFSVYSVVPSPSVLTTLGVFGVLAIRRQGRRG